LKIKASHGSEEYWKAFEELPSEARELARDAYRLWKANPNHPSLRFKRLHKKLPVYSVRVGLHWRAMGVLRGDLMIWFWIGSHAGYDRLLSQFRRGKLNLG
jgi:hypothetical protein